MSRLIGVSHIVVCCIDSMAGHCSEIGECVCSKELIQLQGGKPRVISL